MLILFGKASSYYQALKGDKFLLPLLFIDKTNSYMGKYVLVFFTCWDCLLHDTNKLGKSEDSTQKVNDSEAQSCWTLDLEC